jgi:N-acetylglucosaminyl-diphospho-decaprenol L-rhamnosyltransferase
VRPDSAIDAVIVHYHAAAAVREAVAALRRDARQSGLALRILVSDNGSTADERALLESTGADVVDNGRNAGYAGAINAAFPRTTADCIVVMNEDVLVEPGCLHTLHAELAAGAAVAGPLFYWDRQRTFMLPCTEERTRRNELLKIAGRRDARKLGRARSAWREHARRHWLAAGPLPTVALSGAMLAFRRDTWTAAGPFDEQYALYFEENDWLLRVAQAGLRCVYVPAASAIHLHKPSLAQSPERLEWQARSFQRFGARYYGEPFMRRLAALSDATTALAAPAAAPAARNGTSALWLEATPSPWGFPAAAARVTSGTEVAALVAQLAFVEGPLFTRLVDADGNEVAFQS